MSTSNTNHSTASLNSPGECVVCGKESQLRCSACLSHGLNWMFFCSKDHQKLIWPFHKRVCGALAKPFHWPSFTESELLEYTTLAGEPCRGPNGETTNMVHYGKNTADIDSRVDSMLSYMEGLLRCLEPPDRSPLPPYNARLVVNLRSIAWKARLYSGPFFNKKYTFSDMLDSMVQHPFDFLASVECRELKTVVHKPDDELPTWWNDFQHKAVILVGLNCLVRKDKVSQVISSNSVKLVDYRRYARNEVIRYCRQVIKPVDSEVANRIESNLMPWLEPAL